MPHIHEKIDFTAEVFIVKDGKVLLRVHDKFGYWCSIGGHIELHEDPAEAAIREVKEEAGLDITLLTNARQELEPGFYNLPVPHFVLRHKVTDAHEHVTFVYVASTQSGVIAPDATETQTEFRWFDADEIKDTTIPMPTNIRHYASQALSIAEK